MSDRAIGIIQVAERTVPDWLPVALRRAYVPLVTVILLLVLGSVLVYEAEPLAAPAPEQRKESGTNPELTPQEEKLAEAVIQPGFASRGGREQLVFIGNSQTMAVPYAEPWDISTPQWVQVLLSRQSPGEVDVHRASLGGMTFPEAAIRTTAFLASAATPAAIVLDIRPEMLSDLSVRSEVRAEIQEPAVGSALNKLVAANAGLVYANQEIESLLHDSATVPRKPVDMPWAGRVETRLQEAAERWKFFAQRDLFIELVNISWRKYRNRWFGVNSASVRPLENSIYTTNLELLQEVLSYAGSKGDRVVIYLGPLRSIQPNPNPPDRIAQIRRDLAAISSRDHATFLDYSNLVPETYWTNYEPVRLNQLTGDAGQPDFAHLRAPAHRLIADHLVQDAALVQKPTR